MCLVPLLVPRWSVRNPVDPAPCNAQCAPNDSACLSSCQQAQMSCWQTCRSCGGVGPGGGGGCPTGCPIGCFCAADNTCRDLWFPSNPC